MVPTIAKRVAVCAALAAGAIGVSGCADRSEYDVKAAEFRSQTDKLAKADEKASQLQKDLDAAKNAVARADQAKQNAEAKITALDQENAILKDQIKQLEQVSSSLKDRANRLEQASTGLTAKVSQLQKDLVAAKGEIEKAEKAKKDAESWELTFKKTVRTVRLEFLADNRVRLGPKGSNLVFTGVYQFDGKTLSMVAENAGYPDLAWTMKKPGLFEIVKGSYAGASMKRKVAAERE
jgi:hypothetical protein